MEEDAGCPEPLERIFRQVEEESERRAAQLAHDSDARIQQSKTRRRGSISISRLGHFAPGDICARPQTLSFYQTPLGNASTSSIASGASAFSDDNAHTEDPTQVFQIEQIMPKSGISRIITRRLSRARSALVSPIDATIDVSIQETTVHSSAPSEEGEPHIPSRRGSIVARDSLRKQSSVTTISEAESGDSNGNWVSKARGFTQKFRRKSKQDPQSPTTAVSPS